MMALLNIKSLALLAWALVNAACWRSAIGGSWAGAKTCTYPMPLPVVHPSAAVEIALSPGFSPASTGKDLCRDAGAAALRAWPP